jgi:AraC-like DNA-binding protein
LATADELKLNDSNFFYPFLNQQYFLNKEATIEDFCKKNNIEERDSFNEYIINNYNMSFNNLVNKNRVEYFVYLTKESKYKNFSIEALAKEAGFSSRTALYKPFKKFHGGTPIDLIDSISH